MTQITLSELRDSVTLSRVDNIAIVINTKTKEEMGYFIQKSLKKEFKEFIEEIKKKGYKN